MKKTQIIKELGQLRISRLMNEKKYWLIIATAFNSYHKEDQKLYEQLSKLSLKEILQFHLRTLDLSNRLHVSKIGIASNIMNGPYIETFNWEFHVTFRHWIITLGERVYYQVLKEPDYLVNFYQDKHDRYYFFYHLDSVSYHVFSKKTNHDIDDFIDLSMVSDKTEPKITEDYKSELAAQKACPNLYVGFSSINKKRERKEKQSRKED